MNYRLMIIEEALKQGMNVPVDMVLELAASGQDITSLIGHLDGFTVIETLEQD